MTSDEPIYSEDILKWIDKPHLDYSHKTRIIKDVIYKINFKIKSVLKSVEDPIQINKSKLNEQQICIYHNHFALIYMTFCS